MTITPQCSNTLQITLQLQSAVCPSTALQVAAQVCLRLPAPRCPRCACLALTSPRALYRRLSVSQLVRPSGELMIMFVSERATRELKVLTLP